MGNAADINPGWLPSGPAQPSAAPAAEAFAPTVRTPQGRTQPSHISNKAARPGVPGLTSRHVFPPKDVSPGLQRLLTIVGAHADLLGNLATETGWLNTSINTSAVDALHNCRLLTAQIQDGAVRNFQRVQLDLGALIPETVAVKLGIDVYNLRAELSTHNK